MAAAEMLKPFLLEVRPVDESNIECDTLEQAHFVIALFVSAVSDVIS